MEENCKEFLVHLTDFDYRVFMYVFVFKNTEKQMAEDHSYDIGRVHRSITYIKRLRDFRKCTAPIREEVENSKI